MNHYNLEDGTGSEPDDKLAAGYDILRDLSGDQMESWLESDDLSPSNYEKAAGKFLSTSIDEKIADVKARAQALEHQSKIRVVKQLREAFCHFSQLPFLSGGGETAVVYCGGEELEPTEQRKVDLRDWYEAAELDKKLPWASHTIVIMKSPIKDTTGMVRYRVMIEKKKERGGGALCIALQAGSHHDRVRLELRGRSKTFLKTVLPTTSPVSFALILE